MSWTPGDGEGVAGREPEFTDNSVGLKQYSRLSQAPREKGMNYVCDNKILSSYLILQQENTEPIQVVFQ
jgi:hypothetical protein